MRTYVTYIAEADSTARRLSEAVNSDRPTLVLVDRPDNPSCAEAKAAYRKVSLALAGKAHFVYIDGDNAGTSRYGVDTYPTLIIFCDGQELWRSASPVSAAELTERLGVLL